MNEVYFRIAEERIGDAVNDGMTDIFRMVYGN